MIISANTDELESNSARASRLCGSIRADAQALDSALKALQASWKGQAATQAAACEHEWAQAQNQVNACLEHISLAWVTRLPPTPVRRRRCAPSS